METFSCEFQPVYCPKKKGLKVDTSMDIAVLVVKYVNTKSWNISEVTGFQTKRIGCISRQHNTVQYMVQ